MTNAEGEAEEANPRQRTNLRKTLRCQSKLCRLFRGRSFGLNGEPLRRAAQSLLGTTQSLLGTTTFIT